MSSDHGSDHGSHLGSHLGQGTADAHGAHHEAFDPEPVQELAPGEGHSPGWLPVVGGALLLVTATWFFYTGPGGGPAVEAAPASSAPATAAAVPAAPVRSGARPLGSALKLPEGGKRRLSDLKAIQAGAPKPASSR